MIRWSAGWDFCRAV